LRNKKLMVMLNYRDLQALKECMEIAGESNKSNFVRWLIHDYKRRNGRK
jgi:hypothetical protein